MISTSAVFVKVVVDRDVPPTVAGFYRLLFGGLALLAIVSAMRGRFWFGLRHFLLAGAAAVIFSLDLFCCHRSIQSVGAGLATLLANFQVFLMAAYGVLVLKDKLTWRLCVSIPMAVTGLYLIVGPNWNKLGEGYQFGIMLGLVTACCYAAYVVVIRKVQTGADLKMLLGTLCVISLLAACFMGGAALTDGDSFRIPDARSWLALIAYGLGPQVLGWYLISAGAPKVEPPRIGLILLLQPTLAMLWGVAFFTEEREGFGALKMAGAVLALTAIYLGSVNQKKQNDQKS